MDSDLNPAAPSAPPARDGAQTIHRVAALLREIAAARGQSASLGALAVATGLARPTVHRILQALVGEQMLAQEASGKTYRPGPLLYELGLAAAPRLDLRALCRPSLERLAEQSGDSVYLTIRSGEDALCLDRCEGTFPIKALPLEIGNRRPLGVGAGALAVLAGMPPAEAELALAGNAVRFPRYRLTDAKVREALEQARRDGYSVSTGRFVARYRGVAAPVPVPPHRGVPAASLSVVAISERLAPPRLERVARLLLREAAALAVLLTRSALADGRAI
ncbi:MULTISPECIES: IclR family transcriptional regulator [Roseomonadaceae]|uniref:IclR family transcriptional regulator n=1 Tax=Falsiroseomonas oleicola TaxID=2801474 RepID=A0ABS6H9F5_9PROT|nr:IclR family transcriptional regulator [Roseomonas oleicola]MBU8545345.1 IclR family transcriptional regulator [Roseomonas oleicola]